MMGQDEIIGTLQRVIRGCPADEAEAVFLGHAVGVTRYANSTIHQNMADSNRATFFRTVVRRKFGMSWTNAWDEEGLKSAMAKAVELARCQPESAEVHSLPGPQPIEDVRSFVHRTALMTPEGRAESVRRSFDAAKRYGLSVAGSFSTGIGERAVVNSRGVEAYLPTTWAIFKLIVSSDDSSGYASSVSRDVTKIEVDRAIQRAVQRCLDGRRPRDIGPGTYQAILEPSAIGELLEWMSIIGLGAKPFQEGTSFLSGRLGERIMGDKVTILDDGLHDHGMPISFDFEGVPKRRKVLVERGVARGVVYDSRTAAMDGKESTGHSSPPDSSYGPIPYNLFVEPGDATQEEMIQKTERGILVPRFHYVNGRLDTRQAIFTGMTRDGAFYIEDGRTKYPVKNLRFTESMLRALSSASLISKEREIIAPWWGDTGCMVVPTLLVNEFNFTGQTLF